MQTNGRPNTAVPRANSTAATRVYDLPRSYPSNGGWEATGLAPARPSQMNLSKYAEKAGIEIFLSEFSSICCVNRCTKDARTIHVKNCLEKEASLCRRHTNMGDMVDDLNSRFVTTLRETKRLLLLLQQGGRSFHQLGDKVARLVDLVYGHEHTDNTKVNQFAMAVNDV